MVMTSNKHAFNCTIHLFVEPINRLIIILRRFFYCQYQQAEIILQCLQPFSGLYRHH